VWVANCWLMIRPTTSGVPPAANGTITRTGLPGYCACAGMPAQATASIAVRAPSQSRWTRPTCASLLSAGLDARQEPLRGPVLDGLQIGGIEAPIGDALVDLGAVAEGEIRAVQDLGDRHHLEQRRDLA